jgi:hypothetical protein
VNFWLLIGVLAVGTILFRLGGIQIGRRIARSSGTVLARLLYLAPAVLGGLIAAMTFTEGADLVLDARALGLVSAVLAVVLRAPALVVIGVAMLATAASRQLLGF